MPGRKLPVLAPNLQVSFYYRLESLRNLYLDEALRTTVLKLDTPVLDAELAKHVSPECPTTSNC